MSSLPPDDRRGDGREDEEQERAEAEAAHIGGSVADEDVDPAWRAVAEDGGGDVEGGSGDVEGGSGEVEGGGGDAEGSDEPESELIEHASHGDEQSAHGVLHHQGCGEELNDADDFGEADHERSTRIEGD